MITANYARKMSTIYKWLIGHAESGVDKDGGHIGLVGVNISF